MGVRFFLDTCSIIALSGLDDKGFHLLRNLLEKSNSGLYASHVQADEIAYNDNKLSFEQMCERAFRRYEQHGIKISLEATRGMVVGISRIGSCRVSEDDIAGIDGDLRNEVKKCMEEKGKYETKPFDEKAMMNIARDSLIAVTSVDYDYFITSDDCLYKSWIKILQKDETRKILGKTLNIMYVEPDAERILDKMRLVLE